MGQRESGWGRVFFLQIFSPNGQVIMDRVFYKGGVAVGKSTRGQVLEMSPLLLLYAIVYANCLELIIAQHWHCLLHLLQVGDGGAGVNMHVSFVIFHCCCSWTYMQAYACPLVGHGCVHLCNGACTCIFCVKNYMGACVCIPMRAHMLGANE